MTREARLHELKDQHLRSAVALEVGAEKFLIGPHKERAQFEARLHRAFADELGVLVREASAPPATSTPVLDAFDAEGEARDVLKRLKVDDAGCWLEPLAALARRAFFLGQHNPEESAQPAADKET